ncbi:uncharacterized protein Z519_00510 [Cladophialophora bantiana CBS 173.52]|uniref:F-box domain-containing protein n=1 Tax=Cladophialophora bantiana (strain ATCC 10958 / CBS 173.52 / CDC B-1940 / NIH 8579) TaxID=1442370 RepID=A0A0D2GKB1_CLAB1|nr:uncharacterized protein Z519_00510 [Cladophialophora bantiana CBS 173.52]KIW98847.1 hypothetical protein Z519_00510 [Cladophialophora bantiana CBS 173.52]
MHEPAGYGTQRHWPSVLNTMDGACEGADDPTSATISRTSSSADLRAQPIRSSMVHFLSDDHLNWRERERATFVNPFSPEELSSRKTSTSSEATEYLRPNAFAGHRDTLARLTYSAAGSGDDEDISDCDTDSFLTALTTQPSMAGISRRASNAGANLDIFCPQRVVENVLKYMAFDDYKAMRLVCRQWHATLPRPSFPGAYRLPREILKEVFSYLSPSDFEAARHTCRSWFLASLDRKVLGPMLRASGCQTALAMDLEQAQGHIVAKRRSWETRLGPGQTDAENVIDKEWLCSKRLATESRLSPNWRGSSLSGDSFPSSRLSIIEEVDFSKIMTSHALPKKTRFTVSACGRFVLVVSGSDISVYSLSDSEQSLVPVVRLATGIDVLKVSMDTSSGRWSVAALLAGRVGMLWDLNGRHIQTRYRNSSGDTMSLGMHSYIHSSVDCQPSRVASINLPISSQETHVGDVSDSDLPPTTPENYTSLPTPPLAPPFVCNEQMSSSESPKGIEDRLGISIETRATAVFTDLGSEDDQPRSVAICPSGNSVAFGCRMGLELHWVNVLAGVHFSRWLPLAAPSDYLYFLPRRRGVDSGRKLRLISSAAGPAAQQLVRSDSTPAKWKYWPTPAAFGRRQSLTRLFFGNLPFPTPAGDSGESSSSASPPRPDQVQGVLRTIECDHFHAIPVSDGIHLIFIHPGHGSLCLGSDASLGGPTNLVSKIVFIPPPGQGHQKPTPRRYAVGKALGWGLRLVVVYDDDQVVLYSIPSDVFGQLQDQRSSIDVWDENSGVLGQSDLIMDSLMNRDESGTPSGSAVQETPENDDNFANEPLQVAGSVIARVTDQVVDDIAVSSENGGLSVWIFYRNGLAALHSIYARRRQQARRRFVGENGFIWDCDKEMSAEAKSDSPLAKGKERADEEAKHVRWAG